MKISFVLPSFNCAAWLPHAIESVFAQTVPCQAVIVDDCSTDSTKDYLAWLEKQGKDVLIIRNEKNMGRSYSRNIGNSKASGDVICVLDADDYAEKNRAQLTLQKFQKGAQFLYGSAIEMNVLGAKGSEYQADVFNLKSALEEPFHTKIVHSTVAYTKDFALKYPYRDADISRLGIDDWDQQMRAAMDGVKFDFIQQPITAYRMLSTSISNKRDPKEVLEAKKKILEGLKVPA